MIDWIILILLIVPASLFIGVVAWLAGIDTPHSKERRRQDDE